MNKLVIYSTGFLLMLFMGIGGTWHIYQRGYRAGLAKDQAKLVTAEAQLAVLTTALKQTRAAIQEVRQKALAQQALARLALTTANKRRLSNAKRMARLQTQLKQIETQPECAVLKERLCDAISDY